MMINSRDTFIFLVTFFKSKLMAKGLIKRKRVVKGIPVKRSNFQ